MTLTSLNRSYNLPLQRDRILSGDPEQLLLYFRSLVGEINKALEQSAAYNNIHLKEWTPVAEGAGVAGTGTYDTQVGFYMKQAKWVFIQMQLNWDAANHTGTGNVKITGLPVKSLNEANAEQILVLYEAQSGATTIGVAQLSPNSTELVLLDQDGTALAMANDHEITITGAYRSDE